MGNLRVEGQSPNHLVPGLSFDILGLQRDVVQILDMDGLPSLRNLQVDLGRRLPNSTVHYLESLGIAPELWICPPKWQHESDPFQPFSLPTTELVQRLAVA